MKPGMDVVAFATVVALCSAAFAQVEQRSNCRQPELRERASCLSKIEDESAISELLDVAKQMLLERYPSKQDFVYAAGNAGLVAAKTKTERLVLIVTKGDATARRFGLIALRHTLSILPAKTAAERIGTQEFPGTRGVRQEALIGDGC